MIKYDLKYLENSRIVRIKMFDNKGLFIITFDFNKRTYKLTFHSSVHLKIDAIINTKVCKNREKLGIDTEAKGYGYD